MRPLEVITLYSNPPFNFLGTILFLSYIILALSFTISILSGISKNSTGRTPKDVRHARLLSCSAFASFGTLSYHMLKFLIISYMQWRMEKNFFKPDASNSVWQWMMESTLFEDFAKEILRRAEGRVWTMGALMGTWFWGAWAAQRASERALSRGQMLPYIALGQILPISFSSTLLLLRTLVEPPKPRKDVTSTIDGKHKSNTVTKDATSESSSSGFSFPVATIIFNSLLLVLPYLRDSSYLIAFVLLTRFYLLLPHLGIVRVKSADEWTAAAATSSAFLVVQSALALQQCSVMDIFWGVWNGGEALKALGWDAVLGGLVAGWAWTSGVL